VTVQLYTYKDGPSYVLGKMYICDDLVCVVFNTVAVSPGF